jgi:AraC family transcriptional regulator
LLDPDLRFDELQLALRLFFEDAALLWATTTKLTQEIERGAAADRFYVEALSLVLMAELGRLNRIGLGSEERSRGGLAAWQWRSVKETVEQRLAEPISLITLADSVRLSPRHFVRAFKESFGQPPHRYHLSRRVERAKMLPGNGKTSVTEIAIALGFADTSAFSSIFRGWPEQARATTAALLCNDDSPARFAPQSSNDL